MMSNNGYVSGYFNLQDTESIPSLPKQKDWLSFTLWSPE